MKRLQQIVWMLSLVSILQVSAQGNGLFCSKRLAEIAQAVHPTLDATSDGIQNAGFYKEYPLTATCSNGTITHLGIRLFDPQFKSSLDPALCDFAERYLLEQLTSENEQERLRLMYSEGVNIDGLLSNIPLSDPEISFSIRYSDRGRYLLEWRKNGRSNFSISLPAQWELISGKNKIELEEGFQAEILASATSYTPAAVQTDRLEKTTSKGVLIYKQGYYLLPQMLCAQYYTQTAEQLKAVVDPAHPAETLANLLSIPEISDGYLLTIVQQQYGFKSSSYTVPLAQFVSCCLSNGCKPYFGMEEIDDNRLEATLLMVNSQWGYNHILHITVDRQALKRGHGTIQATLHAYTPTHNLENLYDDERQSRTRGTTSKIKIK